MTPYSGLRPPKHLAAAPPQHRHIVRLSRLLYCGAPRLPSCTHRQRLLSLPFPTLSAVPAMCVTRAGAAPIAHVDGALHWPRERSLRFPSLGDEQKKVS